MKFGNVVSVSQSILISVFSMAIVFVVLLLISYMIDVVCKAVKLSGVGNPSSSAPTPLSQTSGLTEEEEVVVITAAVAEALGSDPARLVVRSVNGCAPQWASSGRIQSGV